MRKRQALLLIFGICFILSLAFYTLSNRNRGSTIGMIVQLVFSPLQKISLRTIHTKSQVEQLKEENIALKAQIVKQQLILQDNIALRDQFQTASPPPKTLLPATIVSMPSFFPGINFPEELIIDKGRSDGIDKGSIVISKNNLVGVITKNNDHFSLVTLVGNKETSFAAKTVSTNALGVIRGQGNGQMLLDNVVLSDSLQVGDTVVTTGTISLTGKGYPFGLVIGKITSIEKNPSSLFQKANLGSIIDITRIPIVFVIK